MLACEEEPGPEDEAEVAPACQRLGHRDRRLHLREARIVGLAAERAIPDAIRYPKDFRRLAKMMREMTRAHAIFQRANRVRKVDSVMEKFVAEEARHDSEPYRRYGRQAEDAENDQRHDCGREPCADGEHRVRIAMMLIVQRGRESDEDVTQEAVNRVFDERPREQPEHKHGEVEQHRHDRTAAIASEQTASGHLGADGARQKFAEMGTASGLILK
jgi:hypothetical protein